MNVFHELLKDKKLSSSLCQIKDLAEKGGLSLDEFIAIILPILNADVTVTEQDIRDYITVKSRELSNADLENVSGGCGSDCCDSRNEHCLCYSVHS